MGTISVTGKTSPDRAGLPLPTNPFSLGNYSPAVIKIAGFGLTLYVVGLWVSTRWAPHYWTVSVLCSSASMALGWALGFLFGIPRAAATGTSTHINTNLEQISDWLTKILVGVGLTQLQQLPRALRGLAGYISKDFGNSGNDVLSLSMVLFFGTVGFLVGYLLTRLALQKEFEEVEEQDIHVSTAGSAEVKVTQPATDKATDEAATDKAATDKATDEATDKAVA